MIINPMFIMETSLFPSGVPHFPFLTKLKICQGEKNFPTKMVWLFLRKSYFKLWYAKWLFKAVPCSPYAAVMFGKLA